MKNEIGRRIAELSVLCGEGKDTVFFARNGYDVTAYDLAETGIEKTHIMQDPHYIWNNVFSKIGAILCMQGGINVAR